MQKNEFGTWLYSMYKNQLKNTYVRPGTIKFLEEIRGERLLDFGDSLGENEEEGRERRRSFFYNLDVTSSRPLFDTC